MRALNKCLAVLLVFSIFLCSITTTAHAIEVDDARPIAVGIETAEGNENSRIANETGTNVTIRGGESLRFTFTMKNGLFGSATPHNAFNVIISNVSVNAKYTISITYDGIELYNTQCTDDHTVNVTNCSENQKWIVLIINDSSQNMSCNYAITSFIR